MVKSIRKIFIVMLISVLAFGMICLNYSYASEATISVSSAKVNQNFTVTVNIPGDAVAYEGKIEVTFSNGSTLTSGKLTKVTGLSEAMGHPGNMTYTFTAPVAGNATARVVNFVISGSSGNQLNSQTTVEQGFNVEAEVAPNPTPTPTPTPAPSTGNEAGYTPTGDTVYATEKLNVRKEPSTSSEKLGALAKNSSVKRIAVGANGWDKIEYNGTTAYVSSKYLTTQNPNGGSTPAPSTGNEAGYTPTGDTVYATEKLNIRKEPSTSSEKLGSLEKNTSVKRIAVGANGWDKIEYNGTTAYVSSKYLTTKNPNGDATSTNTTVANTTSNNSTVQEPKWTSTGDTVYSKKSLNVREGWGTSFKSIGGLVVGQRVTRISVGDNGWDKIKYEGKEAYVMSKYLTTSKAEVDKILEEEEANKVENNTVTENVVDTNTVNNMTTENVVTNEEVYNTIVEEIGVIPQVGKSKADYIYRVGIVFSMILVCVVGVKVQNKDEE